MTASMDTLRRAAPALLAAALFGVSTPLAKWLGGDTTPLLLAGLLYLGSGLGLGAVLLARRGLQWRRGGRLTALALARRDVPWMIGAIVSGGMLGPALLMAGLASTDAAPAALLLNLEGVLTALIAWLVFKENADRRIVLGMLAIVAGGVLLAWAPQQARMSPGALLIAAACLCWAVDNNLTRQVSGHDALLVACLKGLAAGLCNTALGLLGGAAMPAGGALAATLLVGFAGYGLSLALFVIALRNLGTARTGAYFSVAPLFGVALALALWPQWPAWTFWPAAALMALGVWLHVSERHEHAHAHVLQTHSHPHQHDEHHQHDHPHDHEHSADGRQPHAHPHTHGPLRHAHAHFPDIHHRHGHGDGLS